MFGSAEAREVTAEILSAEIRSAAASSPGSHPRLGWAHRRTGKYSSALVVMASMLVAAMLEFETMSSPVVGSARGLATR